MSRGEPPAGSPHPRAWDASGSQPVAGAQGSAANRRHFCTPSRRLLWDPVRQGAVEDYERERNEWLVADLLARLRRDWAYLSDEHYFAIVREISRETFMFHTI